MAGSMAKSAAVNAGRKSLAGATGGISEGVILGWRVAKIIVPVIAGFMAIILVAIVAIAGGGLINSTSDSGMAYALSNGSADQVPPSYIAAYQAAGRKYNIPWTILAGVGQVATDQGRSAPSDIADYGKVMDRNPSGGANAALPGSVTTTTTKAKSGSKKATGPATNPSWSNCAGSNCTVDPIIGAKSGEAQGPLLLTSSWLAGNSQGMDPQSIDDAAMLLAQALAGIRTDILNADTTGQFANYQSDPTAADALWNQVLQAAPVELPNTSGVNQNACAATATPAPAANWRWPVASAQSVPLNAAFGSTATMLGMDLGASLGTPVLAAGDGTVLSAGNENGGAGSYVEIDHGSGYLSLYAHLGTISVTKGEHVSSGQAIGTVGSSGYTSGGAVLYFSMFNHGVPFDPTTQLGKYPGPSGTAGAVNDTAINATVGSGPQSAVMSGSSGAGVVLNPCTGNPVTQGAAVAQQVIDASGCPVTAYPNTVRSTTLTINKICQDSISQAATPQAALAIQAALKHLGMIYSWDKRNLPGYSDCSSFVTRMYEAAGVNVAPPGVNAPTTKVIATAAWAIPESASQARPGDLLEVPDYSHVTMLLGDGLIAENSGFGDVSHVDPNWIVDGHYFRVDPSKVGQAPRDSSSLIPLSGGLTMTNVVTSPAVAFAIYYGGDFNNDPRAGQITTPGA